MAGVEPASEHSQPPNVVLILADDLGYSDLGCYGGEIATPNLDRLGRSGVRATCFYNTARCSPSRASLLTGRHPHETGIGVLTDDFTPYGGYPGTLSRRFATMAERLKGFGYATCLAGKWHLSSNTQEPDAAWPTRRGFDEFFGIMPGADSYFHPGNLWRDETRLDAPTENFYLTDAISDHAADFISRNSGTPFFLYLAYTAPHWPLHAKPEDIERYAGVYDRGWDVLRRERHERMSADAIAGPEAVLSERDPTLPAWDDVGDKDWEAHRMSAYAAQVDRMDRGIGRVLDALTGNGADENTIVIFLSDNGASPEDLPPRHAPLFRQRQPSHTPAGEPLKIGNEPTIVPGPPTTYSSYGRAWANLSNAPFRYYKRWVHEGGIATPFIVSWPSGDLAVGSILRTPFQLTDVLPTVLQAVGVPPDADVRGVSMLAALRDVETDVDHALFWEHVGNAAARLGSWKIVRVADEPWELYDMTTDRSETRNMASEHPNVVLRLADDWAQWAQANGVIPWEQLRSVVKTQGG